MAKTRVAAAYTQDNEVLPVTSVDIANAQRIAISSSSVQSTALSQGAYYLANSQACYLNIGSNPTATTGATALPLFGPCLLPIMVGDQEKIAVIRDSTDGYLWIVPLRQTY